MVSFLKSMDKKTWKAVVKGCTPPKITVENNIKVVKPKKD